MSPGMHDFQSVIYITNSRQLYRLYGQILKRKYFQCFFLKTEEQDIVLYLDKYSLRYRTELWYLLFTNVYYSDRASSLTLLELISWIMNMIRYIILHKRLIIQVGLTFYCGLSNSIQYILYFCKIHKYTN